MTTAGFYTQRYPINTINNLSVQEKKRMPKARNAHHHLASQFLTALVGLGLFATSWRYLSQLIRVAVG